MEAMDITRIMKALSDGNRLKIVDLLSCGERCACEILPHFSFTQPTLSHHMKVLVECGLVEERKDGKWHYYTLVASYWEELLETLRQVGNYKEACICTESNCSKNILHDERTEIL